VIFKRLSRLLSHLFRHVLVRPPLERLVRARLLLGKRSSCLSQSVVKLTRVTSEGSGGDAQEVDWSGRLTPKVTVNGSVTLLDKVR